MKQQEHANTQHCCYELGEYKQRRAELKDLEDKGCRVILSHTIETACTRECHGIKGSHKLVAGPLRIKKQ